MDKIRADTVRAGRRDVRGSRAGFLSEPGARGQQRTQSIRGIGAPLDLVALAGSRRLDSVAVGRMRVRFGRCLREPLP